MTAKSLTVPVRDPGPIPGTGLLRNAPATGCILRRTFSALLPRMVRRLHSKDAVGGIEKGQAHEVVDPCERRVQSPASESWVSGFS